MSRYLNCIDVGLDCDVSVARITYNMQGNAPLNIRALATLWNESVIDIIFMPGQVQLYLTGS